MKAPSRFVLGGILGAAAMVAAGLALHVRAQSLPADALAHAHAKFELTARAPLEHVAPLFGADRERVWSPGWNPRFLYPNPAADQRGMVFTVSHHNRDSIWINTQLDLKNGVVQYVYVIPNALATMITLKLTAQGAQTHVEVEYDRTALTTDANAHVRQLSEQDQKSGPEWQRQINSYLEKPGTK
jgi:hypothetical protein